MPLRRRVRHGVHRAALLRPTDSLHRSNLIVNLACRAQQRLSVRPRTCPFLFNLLRLVDLVAFVVWQILLFLEETDVVNFLE